MLPRVDVGAFASGLVRKNLGLKAVALGLAVALWWFVAGESKVQVGFVVPLEIRNIPAGVTITNKVERQVEVRLAGPPSLLAAIQPADVSVAIDLSPARPGRQVVPIDERFVKVPPGIKLQRIYPAQIEVIIEKLETRSVPVVARIAWAQPERRRISRVEVEPASLEVEALPEDFQRIRSLSAPALIADAQEDVFTANARVEIREGHAKIVGNPTVKVTVHFRK